MKKLLFLLCLTLRCFGNVFSIQFSISETKFVQEIPEKTQDFATVIPGDASTYIFTEERDYYQDYQRSYYGFTWKKGGWDCMRHYEIIANGCIPYFVDLENCDPNIMTFLPKELILEAMHLEGVSYGKIDHSKFDRKRYFELLGQIIEHSKKYLTSRNIAQYVLDTINYKGTGKILYLSEDTNPDYLRCCTLIGLKQILQDRIIDYPKIEHIYKNFSGDASHFWGRGFTYMKIVDDLPIDREDIEQKIKNKEFDLIIYGSYHRGLKFYDLVRWVYDPDKIIYLCGEDEHICPYYSFPFFFRRELNTRGI